MENLNTLSIGKSLNRNEMKTIFGGKPIDSAYDCTCGTDAPIKNVTKCSCVDLCSGKCKE